MKHLEQSPADKGAEVGVYDGFEDRDDEECEDVEDDQAEAEPGKGLAMNTTFARFRN